MARIAVRPAWVAALDLLAWFSGGPVAGEPGSGPALSPGSHAVAIDSAGP
jgi:hypothetical protein